MRNLLLWVQIAVSVLLAQTKFTAQKGALKKHYLWPQ